MTNSKIHHLRNLKKYAIALLKKQGRISKDTKCELCGVVTTNYEIHHTKYEGATFQDLLVVCRSCNRLKENCNLA